MYFHINIIVLLVKNFNNLLKNLIQYYSFAILTFFAWRKCRCKM